MTTTWKRNNNEPAVWLGCQSCYTNGRLVGRWIPAADAEDTTIDEVHRGSGIDPAAAGCEELAIFDYEHLPVPAQHRATHPTISRAHAAFYGRVADDLDALTWEALCLWVESGHASEGDDSDPVDIDAFTDAYLGYYSSFNDYVEEDLNMEVSTDSVPEPYLSYFDLDAYAEDVKHNHYVGDAAGGGAHVFQL